MFSQVKKKVINSKVSFFFGKKILSIGALLFLRFHTGHFSQEFLPEIVMCLLKSKAWFYLMDALDLDEDIFSFFPSAFGNLRTEFVTDEQDSIPASPIFLP